MGLGASEPLALPCDLALGSRMLARRKLTATQRENKDRNRRLKAQEKSAAIRAKYGPTRRPSPVVVKNVQTGEILEIQDQQKWTVRRYSRLLDSLARDAGFDGYADYIASGYWRSVRERVLERDKRRCTVCRSPSQLAVHHDRYDFIGKERLEFLKTICSRCHRKIHR